MRTLDEQLDVATRELHEALNGSSLAPASTVARRHKRRRRSLTALAGVTAVAVVIGLTIVVTRDVDSSEPGSPPDPTANTLLFPAGIADADMGKVYLGPDLSARAKGLVESPGGVVFLLSVGDRNGQPMTPNVARREINGNTFTVEIIEGTELVYVALNDCAVVYVEQFGPDGTSWDEDASALLAATTITGFSATVALPAGWKSFGVGGDVHLVQLVFTSRVGASPHGVVLMQAANSAVGAIARLATGDGPLTATTFKNQPAWTIADPANSTNSLIWQDGTTAALLSGQATVEELKQIAGTLEPNHADEWARLLPKTENLGASVGTVPPDTSPDPTPTTPATCGNPRLVISAAGAAPTASAGTSAP
jgi:hypothetical protein